MLRVAATLYDRGSRGSPTSDIPPHQPGQRNQQQHGDGAHDHQLANELLGRSQRAYGDVIAVRIQ